MKRFVDVWPVVSDRDLAGKPWKRLCDWPAGRLAGHQLIFAWITVAEGQMLIWAAAKLASHFQMPDHQLTRWLPTNHSASFPL